MRFTHLANLMQNWGWQIRHEHYVQFSDYLRDMLKLNRVFVVMDGELIIAVCFFYLTNDYSKLYKKNTWDVIVDNPSGNQMYIDKLVCAKWTKSVRVAVQAAIQDKFPQIVAAYYHRAPKDRCVKINRRSINELQSTVSR